MKQEPVAYINNMCNDSIEWVENPFKMEEGTPLYTAPKQLSDEEIHICVSNLLDMKEFCLEDMPSDKFLVVFARAILKKAGEK